MLTNFPNGVSSFGVPTMGMGGIPVTSGTYFFVNSDIGSDGNDGLSMESPLKTVEAAYALMTTDKWDVCVLMGASQHSLSAMLTVAKNRCLFVGLDGGGRQTGHGARLVMTTTGVATDIAAVKVTGVRNSFTNIKIESTSETAESLYALIDAGEYTRWANCSFSKLTDLDQATASDVVFAGDSTTWINCEFGAATVKATAARPVCIIDKSLAGSVGMMDNNFFQCNFVSYTSSASRNFINLVANQDGQRYSMFRSCAFINWDIIGTGTTMTYGINVADGQTQKYLIFDQNCVFVGCTSVTNDTSNDGVMLTASSPTANTSSIAVNAIKND